MASVSAKSPRRERHYGYSRARQRSASAELPDSNASNSEWWPVQSIVAFWHYLRSMVLGRVPSDLDSHDDMSVRARR
jgi:hypothetical protein